ncbi:PEP-CTERM sorting domain-containing protein [Scytonema sp. UIC 10036]|uniref:PEP-CTERM sorting domain-containing protein n=1 Tax=Scytonema sp. UIC 10036 TaxID=2304196 RepID=UPI0012DA2DE5|nr:PEP-CTERM sorting domain-containing protein [Scytonema sp. UIC 10036]MUG95315.1 PEP-CTERM sorting domain-containing protein [Scytonema sp. UIC 10036]
MSTAKIVTATGLYQAVAQECNVRKTSMSLNKLRNNLTKTTAVAAVIGIATCLFPAIAQAQLGSRLPQTPPTPVSANPNEEANVRLIQFSLDTSVEDINLAPDLGEFPGAIQNFRVDSEVDDVPDLFIPSGTLRTFRLTFNANNEVDPIIVDYSNPDNIDNITLFDLSRDGTSNEWLRYDVTFPDSPATLTLFLPSNDPDDTNLIDSLSGFNNFSSSNPIQAVVSRPDVGRVQSRTAKIVESNPDLERQSLTFATVPEPTATASLLGVGALGAVTLLKRNKRLQKPL